MEALKQIIEESFGLRPEHFPPEVQNSVDEVIKLLQQGKLRVAEKIDGNWVTHEWIKKAVLLSFQLYPNKMVRAGDLSFFDKVPSRFDHFSESDWKESGIRCVPTAVARHGSYIAPSVVLMPSFVNIGAYIGENTMVDTWSTVGSCAQVGKNCHLSGGAVSVSAACWNLCRPPRQSSKTTASSAPAARSSKVSLWKKTA